MLRASCHCGKVQWSFIGIPDGATACNCTVCRIYGELWKYDYDDERIGTSGQTQEYIRGDKKLGFHFCPTCGCVAYWRALECDADGRRRIAVNLRLAEPDEIAEIPIKYFDGLVSLRHLPGDGKRIKDYWF